MTTFENQTIGSHDDKTEGSLSAYQYVEVWFDETIVDRFDFHTVMMNDVMKLGHMLYGMQVEARFVWAAMNAFSREPSCAIGSDGTKRFTTHVTNVDGKQDVEELRIGGRWGKPVARMIRTGYVQGKARG